MTTVLIVTPGVTELMDLGIKYRPATDGTIQVPDVRVVKFLEMGCQQHPTVQNATTSGRPTIGLFVGLCIFDTTLNKPIWRNKTNTLWVDSTGATV